MAYRKIKADTKMEVVIRVLRGESMTAVASEIGTTRNSIARWLHKAEETMRKCLELNGANQNGQKQGRPDESLELQKLRKVIRKQWKEIKRLRTLAEKCREGPRPAKCPKCGCVRFYKKGLIQLQLGTLLKIRRNGLQDKIPVQLFACVNCGHATHLEGPSSLYHWAIKEEGVRKTGVLE
ncbi:MAG: helix-turn-helix domain-containing protein [Candidatus Tritonobacter lacicola]|nr:helix-turn-helix domain-containing protein [Candidatus Tritonobacter lacicola]